MRVNGEGVNFKIDTGAAVTALPAGLCEKLKVTLLPTEKVLRGAGNHCLQVRGQAVVCLSLNDRQIDETVFFVDNLVTPLLGKPAISKLKLLEFADAVGSVDWMDRFPKLFSGLGTMEGLVSIKLKEGHIPFAQAVPRRVAAARKGPLKEELSRMERLGVIQRVEEPTSWCAPCIVVPKKDSRIRVCIDFTRLNEAVIREYHPLPTTEETLASLGNARFFTKLDANCGYWQLRLDPEIQKLTTFITPFGRYFCLRLPFGISSAPEIFQREMQKALGDIEGVICQMDDILVCGESQQEHDVRVRSVLTRLAGAGITLNPDKCEFNRTSVKFLGHVIDGAGIHVDPEKTRAIVQYASPTNRKELRRFFGIINYLGKFSASLADDTHQLRQLLRKDSEWLWCGTHENEFQRLKEKMVAAPTLTPYRCEADTLLSTDASSYGLGAAILQQVNGVWKPVAYASRALTTAEARYAQIEKEALAICWACDKFHYYLAGREFQVETDHKPLIPVLGSKELAKLPLRVQRFRLKMMAYSYRISYTPGEKLVLADALSRAPLALDESSVVSDGEAIVAALAEALPISKTRLARLQAATLDDSEGAWLLRYMTSAWPVYSKVEPEVQKFYTFKDHMTTVDGLIFYWDRVFIPAGERQRVLEEIHTGHQGETKCIRRATELVWWPGMTVVIRQMVRDCGRCAEYRRVPREPLVNTPLPARPWWRLAIDLFEYESEVYVATIDYFSRYLVVKKLVNSESVTIIRHLEEVFYMIGIPQTLVSDNAPYFVGELFQKFLQRLDIEHVTSAPRCPQSNGEAERAVQTAKGLLSKNVDFQAALCAYRDTPLESGYSPAQLLFGRGLNSMGIGNHRTVEVARLRERESHQRARQARNYDSRHATRQREQVPLLQQVKILDAGHGKAQQATVVGVNGREVLLAKSTGQLLRRNRAQVRPLKRGTQQPAGGGESDVAVAQPGPMVGGVGAPDQSHGSPGVGAPGRNGGVAAPHPNQSPGVGAPGHNSGVAAPNLHVSPRGQSEPVEGHSKPPEVVQRLVPQQPSLAPRQSSEGVRRGPGVVAPSRSPGIVASGQDPGVVAPSRSPGIVASGQDPGVVAHNQVRGVAAPGQPSVPAYVTRRGRISKAPDRLNL